MYCIFSPYMYQNQPNLGKYMDTVGYVFSCDDSMTMIIIIKFLHRNFVDNLQVSRCYSM